MRAALFALLCAGLILLSAEIHAEDERNYSACLVHVPYPSVLDGSYVCQKLGSDHVWSVIDDDHGRLIKATCSKKDGTPHGPYLAWYENGRLKGCGGKKNGKLHGRIVRWYDNGKRRDEVTWTEDTPHGPFMSWNEDGTLLDSGEFALGKRAAYSSSFSLIASAALVAVDYTEGEEKYTSLGFAPKVAVVWRLGDGFDLASSFSATSALTNNRPDVDVRSLRGSFRAGMPLHRTSDFALTANLGVEYQQMMVTYELFGYRSLFLEAYPSFEWKKDFNNSFAGYLKYLPPAMGVGVMWIQRNATQKRFYYFLDFARYSVSLEDQSSIDSRSVSLGAGYGF